ncbi:MAG: phage shock protein PspC (stress-responsive transcriptional regulator) [Cyclobacteriaceae bacterium]|jgi:phage shock protein PspC (stress-responsive transcriptional regulator)
MILGVSGWLGKKIGMKEGTVRIIFVIAALCFGVGIGLYLLLWIIKLLSK